MSRPDIAPFTELAKKLADIPDSIVHQAIAENDWFTETDIRRSIAAISETMLSAEKLEAWLGRYDFESSYIPQRVGVVMAGNIPAVGFFDMMCVLLAGHRCVVKPSSKDRVLIRHIASLLKSSDIELVTDIVDSDALIATGSDNSNRYFATMAADKPALLRSNRYSVAVLSGRESGRQLQGLADDIFAYFGLGCRSVSRLFVPRGYDFGPLAEVLAEHCPRDGQYADCYRYNRAVESMNGTDFIDGQGFIIKPADRKTPSIGEIVYSEYVATEDVEAMLVMYDDKIQCVVSDVIEHARRADFGSAQRPELTDYPDGRDVMAFLLSLRK